MARRQGAGNPGESLRSDNLVVRLVTDGAVAKGAFTELVSGGHVKKATATVGGQAAVSAGARGRKGDHHHGDPGQCDRYP